MKKTILAVTFVFLAATIAAAQSIERVSFPGYNDHFLNNGFLDMSRFSMKQSFSMSYLSTGKGSLVSNLYRNSMSYKISDQLQFSFDLAYRFTPSQFNSIGPLQSAKTNHGIFIPSFGMKYQPSKNLLIELQYNQADPYYYGLYPWNRQF